jgi:hypothetical protein
MKTDEDVTRRLREASHLVELPADPFARLVGRRTRKRRRERVASAAIGLVLVAGIVGSALFLMQGVGSSGRTGLGGGSGPLQLAPGQYFYLRQITIAGPGGDGSRLEQETWWASDGSGQLKFETNRPDKYVPYPPEGEYAKGKFPLPWLDQKKIDPSSLSTDPSVLEKQLRRRSSATDGTGPTRSGEILRAIRNLSALPEALPDLRAALFEVAARLPGVERHDAVQDPLGRDAVALELANDGAGGHWVLFFDPGHHQLMAVSEARADLETVYPFMYFESAIVDARGQQPSDQELLFPRLGQTPEPAPAAPASAKS